MKPITIFAVTVVNLALIAYGVGVFTEQRTRQVAAEGGGSVIGHNRDDQGRDPEHQEQRREQPAGAPDVEALEVDPASAIEFDEQQ